MQKSKTVDWKGEKPQSSSDINYNLTHMNKNGFFSERQPVTQFLFKNSMHVSSITIVKQSANYFQKSPCSNSIIILHVYLRLNFLNNLYCCKQITRIYIRITNMHRSSYY